MTQQAIIRGEVCFRIGDGVMMPIPDGPVDMEVAEDSVVLGWTEADGSPGSAAMPLDEYQRYLGEGKIRLKE